MGERRRKLRMWEWCPFCRGSLDTGWECNDCGADLREHAYPWWQRLINKARMRVGLKAIW